MNWKVFCLSAAMMAAFFVMPALAVDYTIDAPTAGAFAAPTSDETIYVGTESVNVDRSKGTALIPPKFGSPTSYVLNSGELLTPNLVNGSGGFVTGGTMTGILVYPSVTLPSVNVPATKFTDVTSSLYYSSGNLATLNIPAIGLSVKVYQGTDSATLAKGAGHYEETSIWDGNVAIAAHNRGVNNHFGKIHTLSIGDTMTLTTKLGKRTYKVQSVSKILATDLSVLDASSENTITLTTCVMDQPAYRWCVVGKAV